MLLVYNILVSISTLLSNTVTHLRDTDVGYLKTIKGSVFSVLLQTYTVGTLDISITSLLMLSKAILLSTQNICFYGQIRGVWYTFLAHRSRRLTRWAHSISKAPSSVFNHTFEKKYLQDKLANFSQILSVVSMGRGKVCIRFWGRSDQNCGYHDNRKLPLTYNGQNSVPTFSQSPLFGSLSNLQVTRTGIMSSNLGLVRLFTME